MIWLLGMILLGPLGLAIYWLTARHDGRPPEAASAIPRWRQVLGIATSTTIALVTALFLADTIDDMLMMGDFRLALAQLYLTTLLGGLLLVLLNRRTYRISLIAHILAMNLFWVIVMLFPTWLRQFFSIPIWLLYPPEALLGILLTYPLHAWMMGYGMEQWNPSPSLEPRPKKPGWVVTIGLLFVSYLTVLGSAGVVVKLSTGLPWPIVLQIIMGKYG